MILSFSESTGALRGHIGDSNRGVMPGSRIIYCNSDHDTPRVSFQTCPYSIAHQNVLTTLVLRASLAGLAVHYARTVLVEQFRHATQENFHDV
jgi:hypothetical protein